MDTGIALVIAAALIALGLVAFARLRTSPVSSPTPAVDADSLTTAIRGGVEAEVRRAMAESQQAAAQRTEEMFRNQSELIGQQINSLSGAVTSLTNSYEQEKGTVSQLAQQLSVLQTSTTSLANALKSPTARGSWGENQLRNVIQLAGMEPYCDYDEQFTGGEAERNQRPDVVIRLPNGAFLAVDAKAPLAAYQRMQDETDPARKDLELKAHVKAIRDHVKALADKRYWEQFPSAPDFVVMFIPGEGFVSDAMRHDPTLLEEAMRSRVLIASPVNLLALLLAVAKGWQAHSVAEHAAQVAKLGEELYKRVGTVLDKVTRMGNGLKTASTAYNDMVGSLEGRMLVTLREFKSLGVVQGDDIAQPSPLEVDTRALSAPEASSGALGSADDL
ncbi:MAG: DNA recombination protein RmuC [Actinomycetota bacterium]|jgi:DNA recombination protein RmuC|nr:DNA recombination protein RmuC [Actinomycetota bacterium]MDA3016268.1 DNA recombination protein RmuC [Actinomycetota bacterium]MDA3027974.1 DNA recombination protein RmuC [Actinomycetota bacterium]